MPCSLRSLCVLQRQRRSLFRPALSTYSIFAACGLQVTGPAGVIHRLGGRSAQQGAPGILADLRFPTGVHRAPQGVQRRRGAGGSPFGFRPWAIRWNSSGASPKRCCRLSISSGATGSRRGTAILTGRWRKPPIPLSSASRTERRIAFPVDMEKSEIRIRGFRHRNR
jgi:hypothetical protein